MCNKLIICLEIWIHVLSTATEKLSSPEHIAQCISIARYAPILSMLGAEFRMQQQ